MWNLFGYPFGSKTQEQFGFIKKNGFVPFDKHILKLSNDEQYDIMIKLELNKEKPVANANIV